MDFTIALPERLWFGDWQVGLKSLIIPSKVWNMYDEMVPKWKFSTNYGEQEGVTYEFGFPQGSFEVDDILTIIQNTLDKFKVPVEFSFIMIKSKSEKNSKEDISKRENTKHWIIMDI